MAVKLKDWAVYIRKYLLFSLESTYRFAFGHPFATSFVFSLFLLNSCYPFLFSFLVSTSPVLICTAFLLGILLCYGDPNIPEIEEEDRFNRKVSPLKVHNSLEDLFVKKDKRYTLENLVDGRVRVKERTFNDSTNDDKNDRVADSLAVSSSVEEQSKTGKDYILEHEFVENVGILLKEQSEYHVKISEVGDGGSHGVEGLTVAINRPELDEWLDSSLGSPWQHISIHDAALDSESDRAESSSTNASMTDILPMLNELRPLLDSKAPKSADNSDAEFSEHHESDEDSMEQEDEHGIEESDASNKVVSWTADDLKNVMDLGSSDLERNRRLESLIARRRARKNQIIIFEEDLIDLHSSNTAVEELFRFHRQIPPISAPRRNPFDLHHESEESNGYPPIPGSAPSVLVHRQNPFDFSCYSENGNKDVAGDNLCQPEFGLPYQRGLSFRRHESFASRSLFPSNATYEKRASCSSSRLKNCFDRETTDLESNDYVDSGSVSSPIDPKDPKELAEQEMYEDTNLPVSIHDTKTNVQDGHFYRDELVDFESDLVEDGHFDDPNVSAVTEETHGSLDASVIFEDETERTLTVSLIDGQNLEVAEEKHDEWTLFMSIEDKEKSLHKAPETQEQIASFSEGTTEFVQSFDAYASHLFCKTEIFDNIQAAIPVYDSSPGGSGNFASMVYVLDDTQLSSGRGGPTSTSVESHVQEDAIEVVSHSGAFEEILTSEMMEFEMVHGSRLENSTSSSQEQVSSSPYINLLDEDILTTKEISETGGQSFTESRSPGLVEDFGDLVTSLEIVHSSNFFSRMVDLNETGVTFSTGLPASDVNHQSLEKIEMHTPSGTRNFELEPILEENLEDFTVKEEQVSSFMDSVPSSTGLHIPEESNVCKASEGQIVISLNTQSEEADGDECNEKGIAFLPEKAKPSRTSNLVSSNDDGLSGLLNGDELLDNMEFSKLYKMKSEYEFTSNDDIHDSQPSDIDEFQINRDVILKNQPDFYAEPGDYEVREIQIFDERLLAELDAVGDFHVEGMESQPCIQIESHSAGPLDYRIEGFELRSTNIADISLEKPISANPNSSPHEMDLDLNQNETTNSGFWSLAMTPLEDLELTVYKPKFNILQACSQEELDSTFRQDLPGEFVEPSLPETITHISEAEKPCVGLSRFDMPDQEIEAIPLEITQLTPEKINEDASSDLLGDGRDFVNLPPANVYIQLNDNHSSIDCCKSDLAIVDGCEHDTTETRSSELKAVQFEVVPSTSGLTSYISAASEDEASTELHTSSRDFKRGETDSNLLVVEAKTIEDIGSAFKRASEIILDKSISPPVNYEPMTTHHAGNDVEAMSHEFEKNSGEVEAKSVEDLTLAFKEATKEGLAKPVFCSVNAESSGTHTNFKAMTLNYPDAETSSELFVLEAKSAEDIELAFKQTTKGVSSMSSPPLGDPNLIRASEDLGFVESVYGDIQDNSQLLVPEEKSSEGIDNVFKQLDIEKMVAHSNVKLEADETGPVNLNSGLEHNNDAYPANITSQDDPWSSYVQKGRDAVENESLRAEDKSEFFSLESKSFVDAYLNFKEAAADTTAILVKLEHTPEQVVLDEKCPDSGNNSEFFVSDAKSLEDSNLSIEQAAQVCLIVEEKSFENIQSAFSEAITGVYEVSSSLSVDPEPIETRRGNKVDDNMSSEAGNSSEIVLVEAKSLDDISSAFKLATESASSLFVLEEGNTKSIFSIDPPALPVNEDDEFMDENSLGKNDSEPLVLEEKSVEERHQKDSKAEMSSELNQKDSKAEMSSELHQKDSELFIVEPLSARDSDVIVKQVSEKGNKESASSRTEEGSIEGIKQEVHEHGDITKEIETSERQHDAEVEHAKETAVVSDGIVTLRSRTSEDQMNKGTDEEEVLSTEMEEIVFEDPCSSSPTSLNLKKKKKKSETSDSSSSSSSSSSDSE